MATLNISEPHQLSPENAREKIKSFEEMLAKYRVKVKWKGDQADLKGTGVSGTIDVSSSDVKVVLKLGMLAKAAGIDPTRLEASIRKRLVAAFGDP